MNRLSLSRDYEVPKKAMFLLDNMEMVQSSDSVAYVSSTVTDSIMYGTNGNIGLRHCSEEETCAFQTNVVMNGVYHLVSRGTMVGCQALPHEKQKGATICAVDLDFIIDGESGTLSSIPERRLSLEDGSYRAYCEDVMSSDGGLMFDTSYTRTVGTQDLDLWTAEVVHSRFRVLDLETYPGQEDTENWSRPVASSFMSNSFDNVVGSPNALTVYRVEVTASLVILAEEWEILKANLMEDIWQRSLSSNVAVNTVTSVSCVVEYADGTSVSLTPEHEMFSRVVGETDSTGSPTYYAPNIYTKNNTSELFAISGEHPGHHGKRYHSKAPESPHSNSKEAPKKFVVKKRFFVNISKDEVPTKITLLFQARHSKGSAPSTTEFPPLESIIKDRRDSLEPFWKNFNVDLQLQDEIIPNRTRLSLLYNAFRLYGVSYNLENGLPSSGCSASGDGLLYNLTHYIYFCLYYIVTAPSCALSLIKSVYKMLPACRRNATDLCLPGGAICPMITIKGTDCRPYRSFNNTRLPVNAYVGRMVAMYFAAVDKVSVEDCLLLLELTLETARVWLSMGEWVEGRSHFRLENIAGADEYNSSVSGNFFIHLSAKHHMERSVELFLEHEPLIGKEKAEELLTKIKMTREELEEMREAANAIVIHKNDRLGVYMVHDNFDKLATWKGGAQHPLSSNYHPLAIYRHKLIDLPEVLLGLLLHDQFEPKDFERNCNYYLPLCTFDSPESLGIFAISQCRAKGDFAQPIPFLKSLANLDLDDIVYSADEGLHFGAMSLSLITLIYGLGGVNFYQRQLTVSPILPAGVASLAFSVCFRGAVLAVSLNEKELVYELKSGDSIRFLHGPNHYRIHLHKQFRRFSAATKMTIPRVSFCQVSQFDGAVFLSDSLFLNLYEYNYISWHRVLETLFETYRVLQNRTIEPLNPKEYIQKVVYQTESSEIAFSGIHNILLSRNIDLELGTPDDAEIVETRYGLANAKVAEMGEMLEKNPPQLNPQLFELIKKMEASKISMAIVTYSRSLKQLMANDMNNLSKYFSAHIDGEEAHDRHIKSRPHVDLYLRAAEKIHVPPERCLVFSHHLDRDYRAEEMARFRMFLDIEDPFVSSREELRKYPELSGEYCEKYSRDNPVVCSLLLSNMPTTVDQLEDVVDGR